MKIKIGIVDDHQLFIDGIKAILETEIDLDFVAEADNAIDMLRIIESGQKLDVLITDIRMPGTSGLVLTKTLSKDYPSIAVLVLSMFDQATDVRDVLASNAKGYIPKNVGKKEMLKAIRTLHSGKKYFSEKYARVIERHKNRDRKKTGIITKREKQILALIAKGRTSLEISNELTISKYTVDTHRKNLRKKLGISTTIGLVQYSIRDLEQ